MSDEELSSKEQFYSLLTSEKIIDKEYEHALKDWYKLGMKKMKDYHDLYLKYDVLLLFAVFEKTKNNRLKIYGLCPSYYFSAPPLKWQASLI